LAIAIAKSIDMAKGSPLRCVMARRHPHPDDCDGEAPLPDPVEFISPPAPLVAFPLAAVVVAPAPPVPVAPSGGLLPAPSGHPGFIPSPAYAPRNVNIPREFPLKSIA